MGKNLLSVTIILTLFFLTSAFAETVVLKTGKRLENVKIVEKNEDSIKIYNYKIRDDGTDFGFVVTYKTGEVENIEPDKVERNHSVVLNNIALKSGKVLNGTIVDANRDYVKIEDAQGATTSYSWNDIDTVDGRKAEEIKSRF